MLRLILVAFAGIAACAAIDIPRASAQPQVPAGPSRPVFSPYLNLLNGGNPALNYFGIVQPQIQMQQQLGQIQQQVGILGQTTNGQLIDPSGLLPATGSVATFNNTYGYFNRIYIGSGSSGGGGSSGGSFNRLGGAFGSIGGANGGSSGFRPPTGASTLQPSFATPASRVPTTGGAIQPKR